MINDAPRAAASGTLQTSGNSGKNGKCKRFKETGGSCPVSTYSFAIKQCTKGNCRKQVSRASVPLRPPLRSPTPCATVIATATTTTPPAAGQASLESTMAAVLMKKGPLSICLNAGPWQNYNSGIIKTAFKCGGAAAKMDHCVQAVGFNTDGMTPYWLVVAAGALRTAGSGGWSADSVG